MRRLILAAALVASPLWPTRSSSTRSTTCPSGDGFDARVLLQRQHVYIANHYNHQDSCRQRIEPCVVDVTLSCMTSAVGFFGPGQRADQSDCSPAGDFLYDSH